MTLMKFYGPCEGLFLLYFFLFSFIFLYLAIHTPRRPRFALLQSWCPNNGKLSEINLCRRRGAQFSSVQFSSRVRSPNSTVFECWHFPGIKTSDFFRYFLFSLPFFSLLLLCFGFRLAFRAEGLASLIFTRKLGYLFVNKLAFLKNLHHFLCLWAAAVCGGRA